MPRMPPWPKERVNEALPFQYTGLDYFGPLYIKEYQGGYRQGICTGCKESLSMPVHLFGSQSYPSGISRGYMFKAAQVQSWNFFSFSNFSNTPYLTSLNRL